MFGKNKKERSRSKCKVEAGKDSTKGSSKMNQTSDTKNSTKDCTR